MGDRKLLSVFGFAAVCGLLAFTGHAEAQMEGEDARTHNGFYLQVTGGLGYVSTSSDVESVSGLSLDTSLMIGGSPMPGLAIGGGFFMDYLPSPSYSVNDMEVENAISSQYLLGILGMFVDFYPNPASGLHFQGFAGWGGVETAVDGGVGGSDPTGLVLTAAGGYDMWVSDEWSIGVMGRIGFAPLSMNDVSFTSIAPALLANFTYN